MEPDVDPLVREVESATLDGRAADEAPAARAELVELVRDWRREAGSDADAPAVIAMLRRELLEKLDGKPPAARRDVLRVESLERRVRALSVKSYALGQQVLDGKIPDEPARVEGQALMDAADALAPRLAAVVDEAAREVLRRDLNDVRLEALYAVDRKIMSLRLNRYAGDRRGAPNVTP